MSWRSAVVCSVAVLALGCGASSRRASSAGVDTPVMADVDGDGLSDASEACPCEPEDHDGFEDADGCPDPDNDGDRIADACDRCPNDAELYNGTCDEDGCPDRGLVLLIDESIVMLDVVYFDAGSAELTPRDLPILDALAATLATNPQIQLAAALGGVDGHEAGGQQLALARAQAVIDALAARGVDRARLVGQADHEIDRSATDEMRRRVRFAVLRTPPAPPDTTPYVTGCEVRACVAPPAPRAC